MNKQEIREHAKRLIELHNDHYEFCLVYEDPYLEDLDQDVQEAILNEMYSAKVTVTWDD